MKKIILKFFNYYLLILFLVTFNEFTIVYFDKTPPLSSETLAAIRKINFFILILFFYIRSICQNDKFFFLNAKIFLFFKRISFVFFLIITFDVFLKFIGFGIDKHWYDENDIRFNSPYDMFSNKPDILDHNNYGFRGPSLDTRINNNTLTVAFLGGSTGYTGSPPIPELLSQHLSNNGIENVVYNFSVNSSNHNQHIHRLTKYINFHYDVVIFYGGNNESLQYLQYDTRPSYPYNYFMKNDLAIYKIFLLKYSSLFGLIENQTGLISGINIHKDKISLDFDIWSDKIVDNYISTINSAKLLFGENLNSNKCENTIFIPILQPVNPRTKEEVKLWNKMKKSIKNNSDFIDYSNIYKSINFFDNVHVDQNSRVKIAFLMKDDLLKIINTKCN
tara:strand:- start:736 stop:1905 length:1170 start_codon:yes stop_codon:yes gene_type:complete